VALQKESGIKVGDAVKVLRACESHEMGWQNVWVEEMDKYVGQCGVVDDVYLNGISIDFNDHSYVCDFPFFVLELVEEAKPQKTYVDLCEDLQPFDRVLVRDSDTKCWWPKFFSNIDDDNDFSTVDGCYFKQCIPYEVYEEYIGTNLNPLEQE
jgi:hypothetical protein